MDINNAWLSPTGRIFRLEDKAHMIKAKDILLDKYNINVASIESVNILESKGWVRLSNYMGGPPMWIVTTGKKLTKKQELTILEWCMYNNKNYNTCFSK